MKAEVKIILDLGKKKIELSAEESKKLYDVLHGIYGYKGWPYYPYIYPYNYPITWTVGTSTSFEGTALTTAGGSTEKITTGTLSEGATYTVIVNSSEEEKS